MAHTFGSTVLARTSAASSPITRSATTAAGDTVLVLFLDVKGGTNRAGGTPTFGGVNGTQANSTQKAASSPEASIEVWYWTAPTIQTADIVIPNTGSATIFSAAYTGRAGADMTSAFDAANGTNATSTNPTTNAIVSTVNGAIYFAATAGGWQSFAPSGRTGTSLYETDDGATGGGGQYLLQTTAGSQAMSWTFGTSDDWGAVGVAFKEVNAPVVMTPAAGAVAATGTAAALAFAFGVATGALALTGASVGVGFHGPDTGALAFAGHAPTLSVTGGTTLSPAVGPLNLAGQTPSLKWTLEPAAGASTFAGHAPTVNVAAGVTLSPPVGTLTLEGQFVGLAFAGPTEAALILAGHAPSLAFVFPGTVGPLVFAGQAPTVVVDAGGASVTRTPAVGPMVLAGTTPTLAFGLAPGAGGLNFAGTSPVLALTVPVGVGGLALAGTTQSLAFTIPIGAGPLSLAGQAPTLVVDSSGANVTLTPAAGALNFTGHAPAALGAGQMQPAAGGLVLLGQAPNARVAHVAAAAVGPLAFSGQAPEVRIGIVVPIARGTLVLAGTTPTLLSGSGLLPAAGGIVLAGTSPALAFTFNIPAGSLTFGGLAPSSLSGTIGGAVVILDARVTIATATDARVTVATATDTLAT
jgi:hypothetical protein